MSDDTKAKIKELEDEIVFLTARAEVAEEDALEAWEVAMILQTQFRGAFADGLERLKTVRSRYSKAQERIK